jgi:hypothetical protein
MRLPALFALALVAPAQDLPGLLRRTAEEAEAYRRLAPRAIAEETLRQRADVVEGRIRPQMKQRVREIVSEYAVGELKESPGVLHEFRSVVSIDGRKVANREKARHTLTLGLTSPDERAQKRLLEEFARHTLAGAVTDLGPLILLFSKRRLGDYEFRARGETAVGAERLLAIGYRQTAGRQSITFFEGRRVVHAPVAGELLLRPDGVPVRITLNAAREEGGTQVLDAAIVEYVPHPQGFLAPASAVHRQLRGGRLVVENTFSYTRFQVFSADAEIKF